MSGVGFSESGDLHAGSGIGLAVRLIPEEFTGDTRSTQGVEYPETSMAVCVALCAPLTLLE